MQGYFALEGQNNAIGLKRSFLMYKNISHTILHNIQH